MSEDDLRLIFFPTSSSQSINPALQTLIEKNIQCASPLPPGTWRLDIFLVDAGL
jgi:hypothetical protein